MAGRGGIEDQQIVVGEPLDNGVRDAFEQRRFVHAGGIAGQCHVLIDLTGEMRRHQPTQRAAYLVEVLANGLVGVELQTVQPGRQTHDVRTDRAIPQVPEVVRRIGGDQQHPATGPRLLERRGGSDRGLADAALATDEQHPALRRQRQQHPM